MSTRLNLAVRGLCATPVAALEAPIRARRAERPSGQASNAGGWRPDREITAWNGPQVVPLLDRAKGVARQLTADRRGHAIRLSWTVQAWADVNTTGGANVCHDHPGSFWSGTSEAADSGCASGHALGGEFERLDARGPGPGMEAPSPAFAGEDGASLGAAETIRPKPGGLFLFPSWLMHKLRSYRGTGMRMSLASTSCTDAARTQ